MGCIANLSATAFPRQTENTGAKVRVCFHYDTSVILLGEVVRDDAEAPWQMIIRLEDGWHVLSTECQYSLVSK